MTGRDFTSFLVIFLAILLASQANQWLARRRLAEKTRPAEVVPTHFSIDPIEAKSNEIIADWYARHGK